ncbi:hypothetical protein [Clostridium paraputrificum]|uniref:hypothetical protein n=1 Tax=Clostridium paraputrificum TaxID=29363 RepID=UPI0018A0FABA|nr:hypothetical protein [Clostridium paraputrificum]
MKAKTKKSSLLTFVVVSGVGMLFIIYYSTLTKPLEKILALMIATACCLPFIFRFISMMFGTFANQLKENDQNCPYTRKVDANGNLILKSDYYKKENKADNKPKEESNTKRKPKIVTTKGYEELRNVLTACSKNKLLERQTILEFKTILRNKLGTHYECYSNMKFNNDMHFIYTLIKSSKFTTEDYNEMTQWISEHLNIS